MIRTWIQWVQCSNSSFHKQLLCLVAFRLRAMCTTAEVIDKVYATSWADPVDGKWLALYTPTHACFEVEGISSWRLEYMRDPSDQTSILDWEKTSVNTGGIVRDSTLQAGDSQTKWQSARSSGKAFNRSGSQTSNCVSPRKSLLL